ncbi:MAG: DUF167 domain-containing protein [Patescibacteria group bacterium]|nr:DUF167 domain-containing protein [Patescibacteria group bacterium]
MKTYRVKLSPGSKENKILEEVGDYLKVSIMARPVDGKANQALIELLSDHFNCRRGQIVILKGAASREKLIQLLEG